MEQNVEQTISLLMRTPAALDALLRDLPESWTMRNEGEKTMNAFDVVGHLINGERTNWMPRARMILQFGESREFEPFDRWKQIRDSKGKSLGQLLDEFASLRSESLTELRALNLRKEDLERSGRHPALGAATLSQLLASWAAHDLTHLHQNHKNHGPPVSRGRGSMEQIPGCVAVRRPQRCEMNSLNMQSCDNGRQSANLSSAGASI
ncbi:MAG TPA: DinB family protein [Candidatus Acidoferrum sp.]|jgi:hypothetical protein|nr:DinB family protein [Candidatus Acidoferrum sp.]